MEYKGITTDASIQVAELTAPVQQRRPRRASIALSPIALILVLLYLIIPLIATFAFSVSSGKTFNFTAYQAVFSDPDFQQSFLLSLELSVMATIVTLILVTPTAYWVQTRLPVGRPIMDILTLLPFAVPAIVMALGLIQTYGSPDLLVSILSFGLVPLLSNPPLSLYDTPPLLICAYVIVAFPFVYRPIDNSLRAINTRVLTEAAQSLGSGWWRTFFAIIIPNILPGLIGAALLTFATAMGEYTLADLFNIHSFPVFMYGIEPNAPYEASALAIISYLLTLVCMLGVLLVVRLRPSRAGEETSVSLVALK